MDEMKPEVTLVLHNIRSIHNVGSILRSAEGFGVRNVVCSGYTPYPAIAGDTRLPHIRDKIASGIHKTALGAEEMLEISHFDTLDEWLAQNALPIVALEQTPDSVTPRQFIAPAQFALLLGEEVHGIEPQYLERCTTAIEIPMRGRKESFNVSVSTGIALYAILFGND
jgi:23S rRNA (guanosine2251-2'-O)-methyltransferase